MYTSVQTEMGEPVATQPSMAKLQCMAQFSAVVGVVASATAAKVVTATKDFIATVDEASARERAAD